MSKWSKPKKQKLEMIRTFLNEGMGRVGTPAIFLLGFILWF
jgi:hypothetical protein